MKNVLIFLIFVVNCNLHAFNLDCYQFPNADSPLMIPTYVDDSDETCHPDVLYFPDGWNGWKYWMSHTPYPSSNVAFENPSIVVSNDGFVFVEPAGLINPVADVYEGPDMANNYNSDSHLFMSPDQTVMNLIWRHKNGWNNDVLYLKSSTDGINWSESELLLSVWSTYPTFNERVLSPCMIFNGSNYLLWTVNTMSTPRTVILRYKSDLGANWSDPIITDIGEFSDGQYLWHMDVEFCEGYYHMLASVGSPTTQEGKLLYLGKSLDGIHWTFSSAPNMVGIQGDWDARIYRSALLRDTSGDGFGYKNWYSTMSPPQWRIGYSEATIDGFLAAPRNLQVEQDYDGTYHYHISWDPPVLEPTAYKVFFNHDLYDELDANQTQISLSSNLISEIDLAAVFAVKAIYINNESDPVIERRSVSLSNDDNTLPLSKLHTIYPNPFQNMINVKFDGNPKQKGTISIYNLKGQKVSSYSIEGVIVNQIFFDQDIASGIYLYQIQSGDSVSRGKLLKMK